MKSSLMTIFLLVPVATWKWYIVHRWRTAHSTKHYSEWHGNEICKSVHRRWSSKHPLSSECLVSNKCPSPEVWCLCWMLPSNKRPVSNRQPPPPPQRIASKIKETLNSVKSYNLFSSVLGWQWLANCILNDLKFKVRIALFNLLNFCAQYVSNFHEVCHSPVASRNNETHSILFFYLFVTVRRFIAKGAGKPASALEDIDIELWTSLSFALVQIT